MGCAIFVVATVVAKGGGSNHWGIALNTLWITALIVSAIAGLTAPVAALRSSLGPLARVLVFACSMPILLFLGLLAYFFIVVLPRLA
jgi:hypothetical protein